MHRPRYLDAPVREALQRKTVFLGGPRQVGKTTLALGILGDEADGEHPAYFNWDHAPSAARLRRLELPLDEPLLILDEVHKYARWRGLVKGIFDRERARRRILVTGSARLDHYRKGGDSLAGRYHHDQRLSPVGPMDERGAKAVVRGERSVDLPRCSPAP